MRQVIKFVNAKFSSVVPGPEDLVGGEVTETSSFAPSGQIDIDLVKDVNALLVEYVEAMEATTLRTGLNIAMRISSRGNQYLQDSGLDNALLANHPDRCGQVLLNAVNLIYALSAVIHPFMPSTASSMLRQLNAPARSLPEKFTIDILPGHRLNKAEYLFKRIDNVDGEQEQKWQRRFGGDAVVAEQVTPAGPGGNPEGGATGVPPKKAKEKLKAEQADALSKAREAKKAALAEAEQTKSEEEKQLEARIEEQGQVVKAIRTGKQEGDAEKEGLVAKGLKAELAELRKRLKAAKLE